MELAVVGLSHKTAPVEIRERLAFNSDGLTSALTSLVQYDAIKEAMILSTCNRVEVVAEGSDDGLIREFLATYHRFPSEMLSKHLYSFRNTEAIRHIFRVTSSLDSMMIGEPHAPADPERLGEPSNEVRLAVRDLQTAADNGRAGPRSP